MLTIPLQMMMVAVAGWLNEYQSAKLEFAHEQIRVFQELNGGRLPRLNDDQRRRLAAKGKKLGLSGLREMVTLVTPMLVLSDAIQVAELDAHLTRHQGTVDADNARLQADLAARNSQLQSAGLLFTGAANAEMFRSQAFGATVRMAIAYLDYGPSGALRIPRSFTSAGQPRSDSNVEQSVAAEDLYGAFEKV